MVSRGRDVNWQSCSCSWSSNLRGKKLAGLHSAAPPSSSGKRARLRAKPAVGVISRCAATRNLTRSIVPRQSSVPSQSLAATHAPTMSAEVERNLLNHYQLTTLYPSEWPKRDDDSDGSETEQQPIRRDVSSRASGRASRRMSRFSGLDSKTSYKSRLSGSKDTGSGSGNIVQKDEPDPLGISPSVVSSLRARGLSVEDNLKLRNRFMLSSTTFSPSLFLSSVHQTASTDELLQGLDFLSKSIEKKSASLKVLVESNFERFVKAKATIDNVYTEMRTQGAQPQPQSLTPARTPHSRVPSKGTSHFRTASNPFSPTGQIHGELQKKTALTKESEYGVLGIKAPLIELAVKAEEVWGPALGGRDRGDDLKSTLGFVERNRDLFRLAGEIQASVRRQDYELLVEDYQKAKARHSGSQGALGACR